MREWSVLLKSAARSGIHNIKHAGQLGEIEKAAACSGIAFFSVDQSGSADKQAFLLTMGRSLGFPEYFGMNWDALDECLRDFSWHDSLGYVIAISGAGKFATSSPQDFKKARAILGAAAMYWKANDKPFHVFLIN